MFKGAVEGVTEEAAFGWMYSSTEGLRDRLVLAFHGEKCIGAGRIEIFREDLASAGLGDGYLGYHFGIDSPGRSALREVVLRLDGSDAVFIQRGSRVVDATGTGDARLSERELSAVLSSLKWRVSKGLLDQPDYDYLRSIWQFGVYERVIRKEGQIDEAAAMDVATRLLSVYKLDDAQVEAVPVESAEVFEAELNRIRRAVTLLPVVGLWSTTRTNLRLLESSHVRHGLSRPYDAAYGVGYAVRPEQVVLFDSRAECAFDTMREPVCMFTAPR